MVLYTQVSGIFIQSCDINNTPILLKEDVTLTGILHGAHSHSTDDLNDQKHLELQARNIFLLAYIWGFGAHLHYR